MLLHRSSLVIFLAALLHCEALDSSKHRAVNRSQRKFCILGMCINSENDIEKQKEDTEFAQGEAGELERKKAELEQWQQQEKERKEQEARDKEQKERDEAMFCSCDKAWICGLNDRSVCWRRCCNNEFGGPPPTLPPTQPPSWFNPSPTKAPVLEVTIPFVGDKHFDTDPKAWHPWGEWKDPLTGKKHDREEDWNWAKDHGLLPEAFGGHNIVEQAGSRIKDSIAKGLNPGANKPYR